MSDQLTLAAETRDRVHSADAAFETPSDCREQFVTDGMAEQIIDRLEVVEIEAKKCKRIAALNACDAFFHPILHQYAIWQACERIVTGKARNCLLIPLPVGNIKMRRHEPATGERRTAHFEMKPVRAATFIDVLLVASR